MRRCGPETSKEVVLHSSPDLHQPHHGHHGIDSVLATNTAICSNGSGGWEGRFEEFEETQLAGDRVWFASGFGISHGACISITGVEVPSRRELQATI